MPAINLNDVANNGKSLVKFVATTIKNYNNVALQLHQAACMTLFHVAQFGECHALNEFHNGLRVNDQTALRVWLGKHTMYVDLDDGSQKNWLTYTKKDGFRVVKGKEAYRKDMFTVTDEVEGKTCLITLDPFYNRDVRDPKAFDLEAAIAMLAKAAETVNKKAESNNVELPESITRLLSEVSSTTKMEAANIERAKAVADAA